LFLDAQLELELGQHELNLGAEVGRVIFDQICNSARHVSKEPLLYNFHGMQVNNAPNFV
jgi:hypothetical protein